MSDLKEPQEMFVLTALAIGGPAAIEMQEHRGQSRLLHSELLPAQCAGREALERAGVVFGAVEELDPLFRHATLPTGWRKVAHPEHSMYSLLLDEQGRRRAEIFYKAAFYDRRADMAALRRFNINYPDNWRELGDVVRFVVFDAGKLAFDPEGLNGEEADATCRAWLAHHWPDWTDAGAYWT